MLKFKDKKGTTKFILRDNDTSPQDPDKIMLQEVLRASEEDKKEEENAKPT